MSETVEFLAYFPPIQSAIMFDGNGGARIRLDIPETEIGNFIRATVFRGKRLKVTLELFEDLIKLDENAEQAGEGAKKRVTRLGRRKD